MALTSVWEGSDGELLEEMMEFYARVPVDPVLDATYNEGRFWTKNPRRIYSMDVKPVVPVDYICDNQVMSGVPSKKFGVVVYDPPHVGNNGRDKSVKKFDTKFGAHVVSLKKENYTLSHLYPGFLKQAHRVLVQEGLVLAKITDQVNSHRSRWAHVDFMRMAEEAGFCVCDLIIKVRKGPMMSSKWKKMVHARKRHCFWIILRKSGKCG